MTKKKIHIDELFRNGLKNLSLFVSTRDLDAIDDKKNLFEEQSGTDNAAPAGTFSDFEMEITEADWNATLAKLDAEKASMAQDNAFSKSLSGLELEPHPDDWKETLRRYKEAKRRRRYLLTGSGFLLLLLLFAGVFMLNRNVRESGSDKLAVNSRVQHDELPPAGKNDRREHIAEGKSAEPENKPHDIPAVQNDTKPARTEPVRKGNADFLVTKPDQNEAPAADRREQSNVKDDRTDRYIRADILSDDDDGTENNDRVTQGNHPGGEQVPELKPEPEENNPKPSFGNLADSLSKKMQMLQALPTDTPVSNNNNRIVPPKPTPSTGIYAALSNNFMYAYRQLPSSNNALYNQVRNDGERPSLLWSAGLEFGLTRGQNRMATGFRTEEQHFVTNYRYSYRVYDSLPVWNPGRTEIIGYFLVRGRDTSISEKNEVRVRTVTVPFEYSRMFKINDGLSLIAGVGMSFRWNAAQSGSKMINPLNNQLYPYTSLSAFERNFNILPALHTGFQCRLKGAYMLEAGFSGSRALYSRFKDNYGAKEFATGFGLYTKLIYRIR